MSRPTFPKCVAAGLLAAVVSPAAAQSPNPWRTDGREVAPAPRPVARQSLSISLGWSAAAGPVLGVTHTAKPAPQTPKAAPPPPEMQASMLRELERMGAQTTVPSWSPPAPQRGNLFTLPPAVGLWVGGFQTPVGPPPNPQDYMGRFPQYFPADPQHFVGGSPPVAVAAPTPACPPPVVQCDGDKIEALSQLANAGANMLLRVLPTRTHISGMTYPSPRYLVEYPPSVPCDPAFPLPRELATPCPAPVSTWSDIPATLTPLPAARAAGSPPVGIWLRSVGGLTYSLTVKDEHLAIAVKMTVPTDEGTVTQGVVLTGDYHVSRDGSNLVGLVTSVDATLDGPAEPEDVAKLLTKLQKSMTDKPFAVSFRVYDGRLVVGNVRLPACEDSEIGELLGTMGGYYQPVGEYGRPTPPKAATPLKLVPASGLTPLPPMVVPGPKARSSKPYPTDPNVRMRQLIFQSEDLRQIDSSWRDFWFREPPHHLTPERIHGAIF